MPITNDMLAVKVGAAIRQALEDHKEEIISSSEGFLAKQSLRLCYPLLLSQTENLAEVAVESIKKEFGHLSVNDLMQWLSTNAK